MAKKKPANPNKGGRPSKFDDARLKKIVLSHVRRGASRAGAAGMAGMCLHTLDKAMQEDEEFRKAMETARLAGKGSLETRVWETKPDWLLERRHYTEYGKRRADQLTLLEVSKVFNTVLAKLMHLVGPEKVPDAQNVLAEAMATLELKVGVTSD